MANDVLLSSQRVQPEVLERTGYSFRFTGLREALADLLR
jgi:NAD dependent epimerase/dehydratase family enzyme